MTRFVRVAPLAGIPADRGWPAFIDGKVLAVFRIGGEVFALDDSCPHAGSSLAAGQLDGAMIACRGHGLRFDVRTGRMRGVDGLCVKTFPARIVDGHVEVGVEVERSITSEGNVASCASAPPVPTRHLLGDTPCIAIYWSRSMIPRCRSKPSARPCCSPVRSARRVTFFHAKSDYGASSVGALERVISPVAFNEQMAGDARALLAKAEAVAKAAGVAYDSLHVTSDRPYAAILEAAEARGCDLIFMASHGQRGIRGLLLGSQTQRVLQHATIPVLVSTVESNVAAAASSAPVATIRDEHRSLAAVISGLEYLVGATRDRGAAPEFPLLRAMLHYIKAFSQALHHPKEDAYLFRKLRLRTAEFNETLDELEQQHVAGATLVAEMERGARPL